MVSSKTRLLFVSTMAYSRARHATDAYLLMQAERFAEAFEDGPTDDVWPIYSRLFCESFGPGMLATPDELLTHATIAASEAVEWLEVCIEKEATRLQDAEVSSQAQAEADARAEAARAEKVEREGEAAKAAGDAERAASELLEPATLEGVLIKALAIPQLAKNAYAKTGLETVGDILTYKAAQPLEVIKGISDKYEAVTIAAIDALRADFASKAAPVTE